MVLSHLGKNSGTGQVFYIIFRLLKSMDCKSIKLAAADYEKYSVALLVNESSTTWQVSHVWLASGKRMDFAKVENFYLNVILNNSPYSCHIADSHDWYDRDFLQQWVSGLSISPLSSDIISTEIESALEEVLTNDPDDDFQACNFKILGEVKSAWGIIETQIPRFEVGLNRGFLFETDQYFYYLEKHWES